MLIGLVSSNGLWLDRNMNAIAHPRLQWVFLLLLACSCGRYHQEDRASRDQDSAVSAGIQSVTAEGGQVYLGGNRLQRPYVLAYVGDTLTINGLALPRPTESKRTSPRFSREKLAEIAFGQRMGDVGDSLLRLKAKPERMVEVFREICESSDLVESVTVSPAGVSWRFRSGGRSSISVPTGAPMRFVDPAKVRTERLEHLRRILNEGTTIFITHPGASLIMSSDKADSLVDRALGGKRLDGKEEDLQDQLRHPLPLVHLK